MQAAQEEGTSLSSTQRRHSVGRVKNIISHESCALLAATGGTAKPCIMKLYYGESQTKGCDIGYNSSSSSSHMGPIRRNNAPSSLEFFNLCLSFSAGARSVHRR